MRQHDCTGQGKNRLIYEKAAVIGSFFEHVEKPQMGFSAKLLQSAARTSCAPMAHKTHTCGLRSIFCQVHAPAENDLTLFADYRRQTLRGFFLRI